MLAQETKERRDALFRRDDLPLILRAFAAPFLFYSPFLVSALGADPGLLALCVFLAPTNTNYILHLHAHRPLTRSAALNLLLDLCLGFSTGMTASNWRIQHVLGHHAGAEEAFRTQRVRLDAEYTPRRALSYSVASLWPTFYGPLRDAFRRARRGERAPIDYRWAFAEQALLILFVAALLRVDARLTLFYALPSFALIFIGTRYVDYLNHYGCDPHDESPFARSNSTLHDGFNRSHCNFGLHAAHHFRPDAHWSELPRIHAAVAAQIPPRQLKRFSWDYVSAPGHLRRAARKAM